MELMPVLPEPELMEPPSDEAGAGPIHKKRVVDASYDSSMRSTMYSGRPMRFFKTPYAEEMVEKRSHLIKQMEQVGFPAWIADMDASALEGANPSSVGTLNLSEKRTQEEMKSGVELSEHEKHNRGVFLTGSCAGAIDDILPAKVIVDNMVTMAAEQIKLMQGFVASKL